MADDIIFSTFLSIALGIIWCNVSDVYDSNKRRRGPSTCFQGCGSHGNYVPYGIGGYEYMWLVGVDDAPDVDMVVAGVEVIVLTPSWENYLLMVFAISDVTHPFLNIALNELLE